MELSVWNRTKTSTEPIFINAFKGDEDDIFLTIGGVLNVMTIEQTEKVLEVLQAALIKEVA